MWGWEKKKVTKRTVIYALEWRKFEEWLSQAQLALWSCKSWKLTLVNWEATSKRVIKKIIILLLYIVDANEHLEKWSSEGFDMKFEVQNDSKKVTCGD